MKTILKALVNNNNYYLLKMKQPGNDTLPIDM